MNPYIICQECNRKAEHNKTRCDYMEGECPLIQEIERFWNNEHTLYVTGKHFSKESHGWTVTCNCGEQFEWLQDGANHVRASHHCLTCKEASE